MEQHRPDDQAPDDAARRRTPRSRTLPQLEHALALVGDRLGHAKALATAARVVADSASSAERRTSAASSAARLRTGVRRSLERVGLTDCLPHGSKPGRPGGVSVEHGCVGHTSARVTRLPIGRRLALMRGPNPVQALARAWPTSTPRPAEPLHPAARAALLAALDGGWADPARLYGDRPPAPRCCSTGARAGRRRARRPPRRAVLHGLRHPGRAPRRARRAAGAPAAGPAPGRAAPSSTPASCTPPSGTSATAATVDDRAASTATGRVDPDDVRRARRPGTALACLQSANHEVGTVQPVAEVAAACREARRARCSSTPRSPSGRAPSRTAGRC